MKDIAYASSEWSGEAAHFRSPARAFANHTKKKGCRWRIRPNFIGQILIAYASSETTGEPAYSHSLARAFVANCTKKKGYR